MKKVTDAVLKSMFANICKMEQEIVTLRDELNGRGVHPEDASSYREELSILRRKINGLRNKYERACTDKRTTDMEGKHRVRVVHGGGGLVDTDWAVIATAVSNMGLDECVYDHGTSSPSELYHAAWSLLADGCGEIEAERCLLAELNAWIHDDFTTDYGFNEKEPEDKEPKWPVEVVSDEFPGDRHPDQDNWPPPVPEDDLQSVIVNCVDDDGFIVTDPEAEFKGYEIVADRSSPRAGEIILETSDWTDVSDWVNAHPKVAKKYNVDLYGDSISKEAAERHHASWSEDGILPDECCAGGDAFGC